MDLNVPPNPCPKPAPRQKKPRQGLARTELARPDVLTPSLKSIGTRGKRLAKEDKKAADECHKLPCVCSCTLSVQWAHLIPRGAEETRHVPWNSIPACEYLHSWLDQGRGVQCKAEMIERAHIKGDRLEHDDVVDLLESHGYYQWLYNERLRRRI